MDKNAFIDKIITELRATFQLSKAGKTDDVAKHRLEGMIHAGVLLELYDREFIKQLIDAEHMAVFNETVEQRKVKQNKKKALGELKDSDPDTYYGIPAYNRM